MFDKVSQNMNFLEREREVLAFWKKEQVFEKSLRLRDGGPTFTFYDGPPTANGMPHIGHVLTRAVKDLIPRYHVMKGYNVLRKAGWDTHGLPVELEVEKKLGLDGKEQIEAYGIEPFIKACKESVWKYKREWEVMSEAVAFWADMEHPYITYENNYIESVWWSLKQIHQKGLLYKGHKVVPYCPRCGTALSSHEVAQGYQQVTEPSAYVRFRIKGEDNAYLWAWTTTPWTLPSNVGLCVNPKEDYTRFRLDGEEAIMADALMETVLGDRAAEAARLSTVKGEALVGIEYEPLWDAKPEGNAYKVVSDGYVTLTDGTGIVHIAPAFGEDDARLGRAYGLAFVQLVDARGNFVPGTNWAGKFVKEADPLILKELKERGLLVRAADFTHDYPFCWRCDTPLLYYARESWFIRVTALRDELMESNRSVNWLPANIKEGRMGNFIENVIDWGVSRERYWGTPLPVWVCGEGHIHVIGSIEELRSMSGNVPDDLELHRPYIDAVTIKCPECGGEMHRVKEVIDCWYDSGSMPFAQWHYPFENKELFDRLFPAQFISEAVDQTRGWFYTLLAISTLVFGRASFESCIVLGHVQDMNGRKMSKHLGNVVAPGEVLNVQGADATRWFFYTAGAPWLPSRFSPDAVSEVQRKFMGTLWNTYAFFILYADIDAFDPAAHTLEDAELSLMDTWLLSKLNTLIRFVDDSLSKYRITEPARAIAAFVDELSNWYVRRCRERFWGKGMEGDKEAAFVTMYHTLVTLSHLLAPFVPFIAENMYRNLVTHAYPDAPISVHLCDFPVADEARIDPELERNMATLIEAVQLGRACRSAAGMKTRQPAAALYINGATFPETFAQLMREELNVEMVRFVDDARAFTSYHLKPQMRTLGPRYGKLLGDIRDALAGMDGNDVMDTFARGEVLKFLLQGQEISLEAADVLAEPTQKPGFVAETGNGVTVVLDTNLDEALIAKGFVREIISKVQTMRKDSGLDVMDCAAIGVRTADEALGVAIDSSRDVILAATLGVRLELVIQDVGKAMVELASTVHDDLRRGIQETSEAMVELGSTMREGLQTGFPESTWKAWSINGKDAEIAVVKV